MPQDSNLKAIQGEQPSQNLDPRLQGAHHTIIQVDDEQESSGTLSLIQSMKIVPVTNQAITAKPVETTCAVATNPHFSKQPIGGGYDKVWDTTTGNCIKGVSPTISLHRACHFTCQAPRF